MRLSACGAPVAETAGHGSSRRGSTAGSRGPDSRNSRRCPCLQVRSASETRLVQEYGLARSTVRRAIAGLVEKAVIWAVQGRGTYACRLPADN
ncbi:GntR family transcriptional regulator [Streptomyces sp. NPDC006356]